MYPTVIIILVRMHKSLWDTREISKGLESTTMRFRTGESSAERSEEVTVGGSSTNQLGHEHHSGIAMVDLDRSDIDENSEHKRETGTVV